MSELRVPTGLDDVHVVELSEPLLDRLLSEIRARHPRKSFGYLLSDSAKGQPTDFVLFEENIRNDARWRGAFESYGDYFVIHPDAGFVATANEAWRVEKQIISRGLHEVGVIHSHQRHPANFSRIDYDMHLARFDTLWHMIVSMRNPQIPVVRVFAPTRSGNREIPLQVQPAPDASTTGQDTAPRVPGRSTLAELRERLSLDASGLPTCVDAATVLSAIAEVRRFRDPDLIDSVLTHGFLRGAPARFDELVAPQLASVTATSFLMGSEPQGPSNFCGEEPRHPVSLSPVRIARTPVTVSMYAAFDPARQPVGRHEGQLPVTGVSWSEAVLYSMWVAARLPTEAEWELCCAHGASTEWCCATEEDLGRHAWYCANSDGQVHPVGQLEPNGWGLSDMHGNVWEWCWDTHDHGFYASGPAVDPVNAPAWGDEAPGPSRDKVTRGGSYQSLPEMCRTRYRFHEPMHLQTADLGFRLACDEAGDDGTGNQQLGGRQTWQP